MLTRVRPRRTETRMKRRLVEPTTTKAQRTSAKAQRPAAIAQERSVAEYLTRFRTRSGNQTKTDGEIMDGLRSVVEADSDVTTSCTHLREFIVAYGVVRTFSGLAPGKVEILSRIVEHLQQSPHAIQSNSESSSFTTDRRERVTAAVDALADACKTAGFNRNLSFASKCLCMLGEPVPIYSSEGRAYLKLKASPSYAEYLDAWLDAYLAVEREFVGAAAKLIGAEERARGLSEEWVAMRGFDVMIMEVGGPMRK